MADQVPHSLKQKLPQVFNWDIPGWFNVYVRWIYVIRRYITPENWFENAALFIRLGCVFKFLWRSVDEGWSGGQSTIQVEVTTIICQKNDSADYI